MEALGVASSVAGILSLVGQSIDGIIKLRAFVKDVKNASKTVNSFFRDVDSFEGSLSQIEKLLKQLSKKQSAVTEQIDLETLQWQLQSCQNDIEQWMNVANHLDPGSSRKIEAFFQKLRVTVNKDGFSEFHSQIARHQLGLNISLSILGQTLHLHGLNHIENLSTDIKNLEETQYERDVLRAEQLNRVESSAQYSFNYSKHGYHETKSISASMSSFSSQLSLQSQHIQELKELVEKIGGVSKSSSKAPYSCGSLLGIEEAFLDNFCIYCGVKFDVASDLRRFVVHLVEDHNFNSCDMEISYVTWDAFFKHLNDFHDATHFIRFTKEETLFRRPPGNLWQLSREVGNSLSRTPRNHDDNGNLNPTFDSQSKHDDTLSNASKDCLYNELIRALGRLEEADLDLDVEEVSDFSPRTLQILREIDWQINCLRERSIVNEQPLLLDTDGLIDCTSWEGHLPGGDTSSNIWLATAHQKTVPPHLPPFNTPRHRWKLFTYQFYVRQFQLVFPINFQHLAQTKAKVRRLVDLIEEGGASATYARLSLGDQFFPTETDHLSVHEKDDTTGAGWGRIDNWMLHILGISTTSRVLISYDSEIQDSSGPDILPWILKNLLHWVAEPSESHLLPLISDGAIDSRDDLASEKYTLDTRLPMQESMTGLRDPLSPFVSPLPHLPEALESNKNIMTCVTCKWPRPRKSEVRKYMSRPLPDPRFQQATPSTPSVFSSSASNSFASTVSLEASSMSSVTSYSTMSPQAHSPSSFCESAPKPQSFPRQGDLVTSPRSPNYGKQVPLSPSSGRFSSKLPRRRSRSLSMVNSPSDYVAPLKTIVEVRDIASIPLSPIRPAKARLPLDTVSKRRPSDNGGMEVEFYAARESLKGLVGNLGDLQDDNTLDTLKAIMLKATMMESNIRVWKERSALE